MGKKMGTGEKTRQDRIELHLKVYSAKCNNGSPWIASSPSLLNPRAHVPPEHLVHECVRFTGYALIVLYISFVKSQSIKT